MISQIQKARSRTYSILRWTEKFTKTDMLYASKGGFWLGLNFVVSIIVSFAMAVVFDRYVPKEVYGNYRFVLSLFAIIGTFSLSGMGAALVQSVARGHIHSFKRIFITNLKWSLISSGISGIGALYYFFQGNSILSWSLLVIAIVIPILKSTELYSALLNGSKRFKIFSIFSVISAIIPAIAIVVVAITTPDPTLIIATHFISNTIVTALLYVYTIRIITKNHVETSTKEQQIDEVSQTTRYGKHLSAMNILGTIAEHIDKLLLFHYLGATDLAIYTFATMIPQQINNAFKILHTLTFPKIANATIESIRKSIFYKSLLLLGLFVIMAGAYQLVIDPFFAIAFPNYFEAAAYSKVAVLGTISIAVILLSTTLKAHKATSALYKNTVVGSIAQIIIMFVGIYYWGLWGAIIARVISKVIKVITVSFLYKSFVSK